MAIEKMSLAFCRGKIEQLDQLIWKCCVNGQFHVENANLYISESMGFKSYNEENTYKPLMTHIRELATLAEIELEENNINEMRLIDSELTEKINEFEEKVSKFVNIKKDLSDQKNKCETGISVFSNFVGLDADMDRIRECEFINVRFGRLPKESYMKLTISGQRESNSTDDISDNPYYLFLPSSEDSTSVWGAYFTPVEKSKETDRLFASLHFETVEMPGAAGTPSEIIENLKKDIEIIDEQIREIDEDIKKFWEENREQCNNIYSVLCANDAMMEIKRHAVVSEGYFFLVGWVVKKHTKEIKFLVNRIDDVDVQFSKPEEDTTTTPPTKLKNLKIARPFEFFIDMYGLPSYDDVDITSFVAVTYTLMFGIMFGDLGQGLILMIVGALMWKFKKMALGKALIPCGISAMFFGLIYGSVFGYEELLDPLYKAVGMKGKPLSVLENVNTILIFAISIGIVLVAVSIIINIYASFKRKSIGEAIFSQNGIAGLLFYLSAVNLAVNFMSKIAIIPIGLSVGILAVGAVILFMKEILIKLVDRKPDWKPESVSDFIMQNIFELLEYVLSYASNTVSFLRVGAFVLVHAGMMMVVFNLAGESKNIFVIILGNVLVIALEGLLTGIQAMRLEFYEMFSRFYEGDGRPFNGVNLRNYKK